MAKKQTEQAPKMPSNQETASAIDAMAKTISGLRAQLQDKTRYENIQELSARLTFLFKVVENETQFPAEYVNDVVEEIMNILPVGEAANQEQPANTNSDEQ